MKINVAGCSWFWPVDSILVNLDERASDGICYSRKRQLHAAHENRLTAISPSSTARPSDWIYLACLFTKFTCSEITWITIGWYRTENEVKRKVKIFIFIQTNKQWNWCLRELLRTLKNVTRLKFVLELRTRISNWLLRLLKCCIVQNVGRVSASLWVWFARHERVTNVFINVLAKHHSVIFLVAYFNYSHHPTRNI